MESSTTPVWQRKEVRLAAISTFVLVVLRGVQCWGLGPLLYSNEFAQLANLAADLQSGQFDPSISFRDFYRVYAYGDHAQGTLLMALLAVPVSWALGPSTAALHAISIGSEAVLVALLTAWLARSGKTAWAVGSLVLLLPPLFVVCFQLMPYANHTEFLWMPVALVFLAARSEPSRRRLVALVVLAGAAVLLYRLNLAAVLALSAALLWTARGGGGVRSAALVGGLVSGLLAVAALSGSSDVDTAALLPAFDVQVGGTMEALGKALRETWPGASGGGVAGVVAVAASGGMLVAGALALGRSRVRGLLPAFGLLWFALAFLAPIVSARPAPEYLLNAWYASLLTGFAGLTSGDRAARNVAIAASAALISASGLPGLMAAVGDKPVASYDGAELYRELALQTLDPDDLPYWNAMAREGRGGRTAGSLTRIGECSAQFGRALTFRPHDLTASRCGKCSAEGVAELVRIEVQENSELDLAVLGAALWIRCNRTLAEVERTLAGIDEPEREALLRSARSEARAQSAAASGP